MLLYGEKPWLAHNPVSTLTIQTTPRIEEEQALKTAKSHSIHSRFGSGLISPNFSFFIYKKEVIGPPCKSVINTGNNAIFYSSLHIGNMNSQEISKKLNKWSVLCNRGESDHYHTKTNFDMHFVLLVPNNNCF